MTAKPDNSLQLAKGAPGPTLLVLAAGMGSRYGGLKQLESFGPSGETILEYSVYDAIRAGFSRVVFVIRREFAAEFREKVASRFSSRIQIDYAFQEIENLPAPFRRPPDRTKPWGTGHAVLAARQVVSEPFCVINADDFYGRESYKMLAQSLSDRSITSWPPVYYLAAYRLSNTLSEHGTVSRAVCETDSDGFLKSLKEREKIRKGEDGSPEALEADKWMKLAPETPVSLNLMAFTPDVFRFLEEQFREFLELHGESDKSEFYLPVAVSTMIKRGQCRMQVINTPEEWLGVTYSQEKEYVAKRLWEMTQQGIYPESLWD